jgi:hypothetical protein
MANIMIGVFPDVANTNAVIYPQRRHTPPPPCLIWHETSFIEENWSVLADVVIRYYLRNSKDIRDARIRIKDNGRGFWMQVRACRVSKPQSNWKWQEIDHTLLTPLTACYQNKDWPWIIISGDQHVGSYCKAINCPRLTEKAETTELWFTVALARFEMQDGRRVVIIDEPMQVQRIRQGDIGVVFRTLQERKNDPFVYQGTKVSVRNRKRAAEAALARELGTNSEAVLDGDIEVEVAVTKKRRIGEAEAGNGVEVVIQAVPNSENCLDMTDEAAANSPKVVDSSSEGRRIREVELAGVTDAGIIKKRSMAGAGDEVEMADEVNTNSGSVADSNAEGSEMEVPCAAEVDSEAAGADSQ